jgi:hypothetical protein
MMFGDVILLGSNINVIKRSRDDLFDASNEVDVSVNVENSCKFMSRHQNAARNHNMKLVNGCF